MTANIDNQLLTFKYPLALAYRDKSAFLAFDYSHLAVLWWTTGVLTLSPVCPDHRKQQIHDHAAAYQHRIGEQVDLFGKPVTIGSDYGNSLKHRLFNRDGQIWQVSGYHVFDPENQCVCRPIDNIFEWWTATDKEVRPLILAWEATQEPTDYRIITGPDGRTYPRLEE